MNILKRTLNSSSLLIFLAISLASFMALKNTLDFYFYSDDYAVLFHHINNITYYPPFYTYVPKFYGWIYDLSGLNPRPYFTLSILAHIIASFTLYLYTYKLTKQKIVALFASLIFSTGYIGVESFSQMNTATVDSLNVFFTILLLIYQMKYFEARKISYYLMYIIIFYLGMILFPFRAFQMILFLLAADLILTFRLGNLKQYLKWVSELIKRNLPFLAIYFILGVGSYGNSFLGKFIGNFTTENRGLFFSVYGNMIFPNSVFPDLPKDFIGIISAITIVVIVFAIKKYKDLSRGLLLSLIFTFSGFIGFFMLLPSFDANAEVNRYLSLSFASFAISISLITYVILKNFSEQKKIMLYIIILVPYVVWLSNLSFSYQKKFVEERSNHARKLFSDIKKFVPVIEKEKQNIFYFEVFNEGNILGRFDTSIQVAYMDPRVSLATHYLVPYEKINIILDKDDFEKELGNTNSKRNIYTFYYDKDGLHRTMYNYKK